MFRAIIKTHTAKYKLALIIALIPLLVWAGSSELPDFADSAGSVISPEYERRLGQMFLRQVRYFSNINKDPEVESYIQSIGYQLASHSDNTQQPFKFFVVNNPVINAFAGPGGMIGMHSGVILNSSTESELAAVMAHEIAHVTQRHLARMFEQHEKYSVPSAAAMVGAILLAIVNPEAGTAALAGVTGINAQSQINFTRANEQEADRVGMQLLVRAGHDPRAMPAFFQKLQQVSRFAQSNAPEFLRTHPLTTSRIADTMARAESYPVKQYSNSLSYELVKYKLMAYSFSNAKGAVSQLNMRLNQAQLADEDLLPLRYGLAHAHMLNTDFAQARVQSDMLLQADPDSAAYMILSAKIFTEQSRYDDALEIYQRAHKLYPDYKPVLVAYSRALLDVKQGGKAREILKGYERYYSHDLNTFALLGQAEAMLGNEIETAIIQADYYYLAGETKLAIDKLRFVQQQYSLDYYQEERVKAKMAELKYELELEQAINI